MPASTPQRLPQYQRPLTTAPPAQSKRHLTAVPPLAVSEEDIPAPAAPFVRALAAHAFEVVSGTRSIGQLGTAITVGVARELTAQRRIMVERASLYKDRTRLVATPGPLHISRTRARAAEAAVVLHTSRRSYAVTLTLEWAHGRWRACELWVL
jgi:hypothetical protein